MKYNSLKEFFYKLYNICLMMMFLPTTAYLIIYYLTLTGKLDPVIQTEQVIKIILISFPAIAILDLTIVHLVVVKRFALLTKEVSLGIRLEKYFSIAFLRISAVVATSLFMAAGLYLTGSELFTLYFLVILLWLYIYWPSPQRVSKDLKLRGDEEKMVLTKGDAFQ
jgi:hypothetical protein